MQTILKTAEERRKKRMALWQCLDLPPPPSLCHQSRPSVRKSVLRLAPLLGPCPCNFLGQQSGAWCVVNPFLLSSLATLVPSWWGALWHPSPFLVGCPEVWPTSGTLAVCPLWHPSSLPPLEGTSR